jgi:hypothetical protein
LGEKYLEFLSPAFQTDLNKTEVCTYICTHKGFTFIVAFSIWVHRRKGGKFSQISTLDC